jgi:hypothetical protein
MACVTQGRKGVLNLTHLLQWHALLEDVLNLIHLLQWRALLEDHVCKKRTPGVTP